MPDVVISGPKTLRWEERFDSRSVSIGGRNEDRDVFRYNVFDTDDEQELSEAVLSFTPETSPRGLSRSLIDAEWVQGHYVYDRGDGLETFNGHWTVRVNYVLPQLDVGSGIKPEVGQAIKRFATKGEAVNVKTGLVLIERRVPTPDDPGQSIQTPATDFVMIGDTGDPKKEPKGAEIIVPVHSFSYDFTLPGSDATPTNPQASEAYEEIVRDIVGTINDAPWKGYPTGSVLFNSIQGQIVYGQDTTLAFDFSYIPPKTFTLGAQTFSVRGWDFADIKGARRTLDATTKRVKTAIDQIDVWQVLPDQDFDLIGIP